jgi:hypothetical protein
MKVKPDIPKIKPEQSNNNLINNLLNTPKNVINK